jgi:hypothetical protein
VSFLFCVIYTDAAQLPDLDVVMLKGLSLYYNFSQSKMRLRLVYLFIIFPFFTSTLVAREPSPGAIKGVLDLREIKNPDHFIFRLNGEWKFYWKKMLHPYDFKPGNLKPDYFGKVPSY